MRQAEELSITITPAAAIFGDSIFDEVAPDDVSARSSPEKSAVAASSTSIAWPFHSRVVPADLDEAKNRISSTGKARSRRMSRMTVPTWPVAPTTATRIEEVYGTSFGPLRRVESERGMQMAHGVGHLLGAHHTRDPNRARRDHLDVDAVLRERLEHQCGDPGIRLHARADDRHAYDVV